MSVKKSRTLRNVAIFSVVALSCGWIGRLVDLQAGTDENGSLGQLIWLVSPLLAMIALRSWGGDKWRDFGLKPRFRGSVLPYAASLLFFPVMTAIVVAIGAGAGWADASPLSGAYWTAVSAAILPSFFKNLFEEFAWRGYMAPRMFSLGWHRLLAHIAVGIVWAAWHFPYLFLFVETTESMITYIPRMVIGVVAMAILYGEIRLLTNSVWPAVIMHTAGNAIIDTLILNKYLIVEAQYGCLAMPSPEGLMAIALTALAGLWMYRRRKAAREGRV